jgi:hypothetical protein
MLEHSKTIVNRMSSECLKSIIFVDQIELRCGHVDTGVENRWRGRNMWEMFYDPDFYKRNRLTHICGIKIVQGLFQHEFAENIKVQRYLDFYITNIMFSSVLFL